MRASRSRLLAGLCVAGVVALACTANVQAVVISGRLRDDRSSQQDASTLAPVYDLIERVLAPGSSRYFDLQLDATLGVDAPSLYSVSHVGSAPATGETFRISGGAGAPGGNVTIVSSKVSGVTAGLGWYLKYYANCSFAWSGKQVAMSLPPPAVGTPLTLQASLPWRYYLNTCTHSYTMAFWDWARWEHEIDWMALQGVNMPLAFTGQEFVWNELFLQFNVSQAELEEWYTGPAQLAWWRMGNIRGFAGSLGPNWRSGQRDLQIQILQRMRALGMTPVLPGFAGHVPGGLTKAFPSAKIARSPLWAGFNATYSGDYLLSSEDPLFPEISKAFLTIQSKIYGTDHVYNADTFNEMLPASNDTTYLKNIAASLYKSLAAADPDAVWMIQGWMFSFQPSFWQPAQIQAYLSGIPAHKMIILDLNAFLDPIWTKTQSFYGTDFIWCIIDNAGGRPGIFGDLERVTSGPVGAKANSTSLVGVGIAPEGTQQNPITYELMGEMGIRSQAVDLPSWVHSYARRRYGPNAPAGLFQAWDLMREYLYQNMYQHFSTMYADRPNVKMGGYSSWTNSTAMVEVWRLFHEAAPAVADVKPFLFDYVDVTRQTMGYIFEDLYIQFMAAYRQNDTAGMDSVSPTLLQMVLDIDAVLATHEMWMVGGWTNGARSWGKSDDEADAYEYSARNLITIWGPDGEINGYATRELSGLNRDYYYPRWQLFVKRLREAVVSGTAFDQGQFNTDCFNDIEKPWNFQTQEYPSTPSTEPGQDTLSVIDRMFRKYAGPNTKSELEERYTITPNSDGEGGIWSNMRMQLHDPAVQEFLCDNIPECGGFVADGWYKPLRPQPVAFNGSTLYVKRAE